MIEKSTNYLNGVFVPYDGVKSTTELKADLLSDLRGLCLDGQTFIGVKFGKAALNEVTFKGATLKNVSFTPPFSLSKKYYNAPGCSRLCRRMMEMYFLSIHHASA